MNPKVLEKLPAEVQVLWKLSKTRKLSRNFAQIVSDSVRRQRDEVKFEYVDPLSQKQSQFPQTGGWAQAKMRELAQSIYQDKKPDEIDMGKWISVEIECIMPSQSAEASLVSFIRKNGYGKYVTLKNDGSIHPDRPECDEVHEDEDGYPMVCNCPMELFGKEIVVTFKYGEWDMLKAICKKLSELRCTVNKTCGLHVHFDCRHLSARQAGTLGRRAALTIPALKQILPKSRQDNEYCSLSINKITQRSRDRYDRYAFVNMMAYPKHGTIEIRGHSGTTDAIKIINWTRLLYAIMKKQNRKPINTASELIDLIKPENDLVSYIATRVEKFSKAKTDKRPVDDVAEDNEYLLLDTEVAASSDMMDSLRGLISALEADRQAGVQAVPNGAVGAAGASPIAAMAQVSVDTESRGSNAGYRISFDTVLGEGTASRWEILESDEEDSSGEEVA